MKVRVWIGITMLGLVLFAGGRSYGDQNTISVGYGLGILNNSAQVGHLWYNDYYDFAQVLLGLERPVWKTLNVLVEPYVAYVNRPNSGADIGLSLNGKYYVGEKNHQGLFFMAGVGMAYTTVKFEEQGTHLLGIIHGGFGYQWGRFFVENRLRHYSNGGTSSPNKSVNAYLVNVGMAF